MSNGFYTDRQIRDAIHAVKNEGLDRNGLRRNPDVVIDYGSGDIYPKLPDNSFTEDPIGNIFDHL